MGIIIDFILVAMVVSSAYLGYKKGLVKLASRLFAGIIAIILTVVLYNPISSVIINNTQIDESVEKIFMENVDSIINKKTETDSVTGEIANNVTEQVKKEILPNQANRLAKYAVNIVTALLVFVIVKLVLTIVFTILGVVTELPLLKQFDETGGLIYGALRGLIICLILVSLATMYAKLNPENEINSYMKNSYITKIVYDNLVKI